MPEQRYPTLEEFWKRLDVRKVEPDLQQALRDRTHREQRAVTRVGAEGTVEAVAARVLPGAVPAKALAVFLDTTFNSPMGRGDEPADTLPRRELIPAGFAVLEEAAQGRHGGAFDALDATQQDGLLTDAERGALQGPPGFDSATWFKRVRDVLLLGFGSDPRGMVQMGFPGPSYQPGYVWLDVHEIAGRVGRKPGYLQL